MLILFSVTNLYSQNYRINERSRLYIEEASGNSLFLKADNNFSIPLSLKVDLELMNLKGTPENVPVVLQPGVSGQIIARLEKINPDKEFQCVYRWETILGDVSKIPDANVSYRLPVEQLISYHISQGPGGSFSHQNSFAYDFAMPVGSPVNAARDGIVAFVDISNDVGGASTELLEQANVISVLHSDGTIANYVHLNKKGSLVKEGDKVKKGQVIALSGNSGYSTGAHLHFEVVQPSFGSHKKRWVAFSWEQNFDSSSPMMQGYATSSTSTVQ